MNDTIDADLLLALERPGTADVLRRAYAPLARIRRLVRVQGLAQQPRPFFSALSSCYTPAERVSTERVPESRTSPRRIAAVERQRQALELRIAGTTYPEIARALGYAGSSGAIKAVETALTRTLQEPADKVRRMELARLDRLLRAIWPAVLNADLAAIKRALDIMERRAKFLGLDAPARQEITGYDGQAIVLRWDDRAADA